MKRFWNGVVAFVAMILVVRAEEKVVNKAAEEKRDYVRVEVDAGAECLQTAVVKMSRAGVTVDLVGAVHIADAGYYEELNERFKGYDVVLFEMVGGERIADTGVDDEGDADTSEPQDAKKEAEKESGQLSGLRSVYDKASKFLELRGQQEEIDYFAKNLVHADLTLKEFQAKQKERKESLIGFALKASFASMAIPQKHEPSSLKLLAAMMSGNGEAMKRELIHGLAQADEQIEGMVGESVIMDDRNAKCLQVLQDEVAKGNKKLAIFYGAAHFPKMERSLLEKGWQRVGEEWLTAWKVPKKPKKAAEATEKKAAE